MKDEMKGNTQAVSLDTLLTGEDMTALPGFPARIGDRVVTVTAVLERTVVYEVRPGEPRQLTGIRNCLVDPAAVRVREHRGGATSAARQAARRGVEASRRSQQQRPDKPAA